MTREREKTLYPTNLKNETDLREFIKNVLLNLDFPSYKDKVKYLLHQSTIPKDITGIISEFVFCNKYQWNDAKKEYIKIYSQDLQDFDTFIQNLNNNDRNKILYNLEFERQMRIYEKDNFNHFEHVKFFNNVIFLNKKNKRKIKIIDSNKIFFSKSQNIIDKLNMYIHILKISNIDMSYKTYFPREKFSKNEIREFNIMYNIEYTNGINLKHLSLYLRNKVEENCMLISPGFRLNLDDKLTTITWNFNVHTRMKNEETIDGLVGCHTGALFGYFCQKLIETIRMGMLQKIKYDLLNINLSLPQR